MPSGTTMPVPSARYSLSVRSLSFSRSQLASLSPLLDFVLRFVSAKTFPCSVRSARPRATMLKNMGRVASSTSTPPGDYSFNQEKRTDSRKEAVNVSYRLVRWRLAEQLKISYRSTRYMTLRRVTSSREFKRDLFFPLLGVFNPLTRNKEKSPSPISMKFCLSEEKPKILDDYSF